MTELVMPLTFEQLKALFEMYDQEQYQYRLMDDEVELVFIDSDYSYLSDDKTSIIYTACIHLHTSDYHLEVTEAWDILLTGQDIILTSNPPPRQRYELTAFELKKVNLALAVAVANSN